MEIDGSFFGHRDARQEIELKLERVLIQLIEQEQADVFYVGKEGNFDKMVQSILFRLQEKYPHIQIFIVLAYLPKEKGMDVDVLGTIYPEGLEFVPRRFAICKRNDWMLSQSDVVITHAIFPVGNSIEMKKTAERKKKRVINIT